jgi:putative nucleotidyltransferase with HDIG domain
MTEQQLEKFRAWFDDYVAGFYGDDKFVNANLQVKEEHSKRTCEEMLYLARQLGLADNQKRLSETIALFHDIGRFKQFVKYRTYSDFRSVDHCRLGLEVLRRAKVLEGLDCPEQQLIEKAIEYHGLKKLPSDLKGQCLLFSKLLRDADKLDIFYIATEYEVQYRKDPDKFELEIELPDEPSCSPELIEGLMCGRQIDYSELRTLNDMKLLQLGWVYDVNFPATLKRIKQRRFLEKIVKFLPATEEVKKAERKIFEYVDSRIEEDRRQKTELGPT